MEGIPSHLFWALDVSLNVWSTGFSGFTLKDILYVEFLEGSLKGLTYLRWWVVVGKYHVFPLDKGGSSVTPPCLLRSQMAHGRLVYLGQEKKSWAILTKLVVRLCSQTMPRRSRRTLSKRISRLESISRPEVKWAFDESGAFDTVGSITGTILRPQQLAEGVGRASRIGDKVKSRNIRFQALLKMPENPSNASCAVRILVLRSKIGEPTTSDMPTWYGSVDEDKFFVVKDLLTNVSVQGANASIYAGTSIKTVKFNLPTGLRKLQYDGSVLQSPVNNEYIIYMLAENQSAEVAYHWKHYYIDN